MRAKHVTRLCAAFVTVHSSVLTSLQSIRGVHSVVRGCIQSCTYYPAVRGGGSTQEWSLGLQNTTQG